MTTTDWTTDTEARTETSETRTTDTARNWAKATGWIKATASDQGGQCVELRPAGPGVEVRDSKDPDGPTLRLTATGWTRWLDGARRGDLDHLTD